MLGEEPSNGLAKMRYENDEKLIVSNLIHRNTNIAVNFVRLEEEINNFDGASFMDGTGSNTGYWSISQIEKTKGTTASHEHNHGLGGLFHPERIKGNKSNYEQEISIDMTIYSYNFTKFKYLIKGNNGTDVLDVIKRKVTQKNID